MRKFMVVLIGLLAGACAQPGGGASTPSTTTFTAVPASGGACTVGQTVLANDAHMRFDILGVMAGAKALDIADGGRPSGDYAKDLYKAVKAGTVERLDQDGNLTIRLSNVDTAKLPSQLVYLSGNDVCRGMAVVTKLSANEAEVTIPLMAGVHLGQAGLMVPRAAVNRPNAFACITAANFPIRVPKLTQGPMEGKDNTTCGLPGSKPGTTRFGEAVARGERWILFALMKKQGGA